MQMDAGDAQDLGQLASLRAQAEDASKTTVPPLYKDEFLLTAI